MDGKPTYRVSLFRSDRSGRRLRSLLDAYSRLSFSDNVLQLFSNSDVLNAQDCVIPTS